MTSFVLSLMLQLALAGIEVNPGQLDKDIFWIRYGTSCWWVDTSRRMEGPKLQTWMTAYDFLYMTQQYHVVKGNIDPNRQNKKLCEAPAGSSTALLYETVNSITLGGTLVTPQGTWTLGMATSVGGNALLLNGNPTGGFGNSISLIGGKVYTLTAQNTWYQWVGSWVSVSPPQ
jgi:hypothetical protein